MKLKRTQKWFEERYVASRQYFINKKAVSNQEFSNLWVKIEKDDMYHVEFSNHWKDENLNISQMTFNQVETGEEIVIAVESLYKER